MRPLSATESITPAIDRTKHLLFSPFRKGRTWKLCATSYACRFGSLYLPFPLLYLAMFPAFRRAGTAFFALIAVVILVLLALFTWVFHLCSRLQFAYFDMVANRGELVAPAWRKYGPRSPPWTFFKIVTGAVFTAIFAVPFITWMRNVLPLMSRMGHVKPGAQLDPQFARVMAIFYTGYGLVILFVFAGMLLFGLFSDFVLPSLALENTSIREGFRRMGLLIQQEPGEFALYVLLKSVLGFVGYMAAIIAWEIALILASLIVGGLIFLIGLGLHLAGIPTVLLTVVGVLLAIVWYVVAMYTVVFPIGIVLTWMDAYAIYFLGGRYPLLGDMLDRSTPPPAAPAFDMYAPGYPPPVPPTA